MVKNNNGQEYQYREAFCLMLYKCGECGFIEILWNSWDNVSPFMVTCRICKDQLANHIAFSLDMPMPDFTPYPGMRCFVPSTREDATRWAKARVEEWWDGVPGSEHKMRDTYENKAQAVESQIGQFEHFFMIAVVQQDGSYRPEYLDTLPDERKPDGKEETEKQEG